MTITMGVYGGQLIEDAANKACAIASSGDDVRFEFSGITLIVKRGATPEQVVEDYNRRSRNKRKAFLEAIG